MPSVGPTKLDATRRYADDAYVRVVWEPTKAEANARQGAAIRQPGKTRITMYLDDDLLQPFREWADASGRGYQTMINDALREPLGKSSQPLDARALRRILREELRRTGGSAMRSTTG